MARIRRHQRVMIRLFTGAMRTALRVAQRIRGICERVIGDELLRDIKPGADGVLYVLMDSFRGQALRISALR
jgi:glucose/arabinose dehydrogenase